MLRHRENRNTSYILSEAVAAIVRQNKSNSRFLIVSACETKVIATKVEYQNSGGLYIVESCERVTNISNIKHDCDRVFLLSDNGTVSFNVTPDVPIVRLDYEVCAHGAAQFVTLTDHEQDRKSVV